MTLDIESCICIYDFPIAVFTRRKHTNHTSQPFARPCENYSRHAWKRQIISAKQPVSCRRIGQWPFVRVRFVAQQLCGKTEGRKSTLPCCATQIVTLNAMARAHSLKGQNRWNKNNYYIPYTRLLLEQLSPRTGIFNCWLFNKDWKTAPGYDLDQCNVCDRGCHTSEVVFLHRKCCEEDADIIESITTLKLEILKLANFNKRLTLHYLSSGKQWPD